MRLDSSSIAINACCFIMDYYKELYDLDNLFDSFQKCKKNVAWKESIQRFEANLIPEIMKLSKELKNGTYKQMPFVEFDINERGKHRHIKSLHIRDRVVQRVLCDNILEPVLYRKLEYDNSASVKGKGVEFARNRLVRHLNKYYRKYGNQGYVLKLDYSKFFDTIPHDKMMYALSKYFDDERLLNLIADIMTSFGDGVSLGIGSQISQICGIYYLSRVDNYIKIKKGCKYFVRYMDDINIIHPDKEFLKQLLEEIITLSEEEMGLKINRHKTQICRIDKGWNFLKLRTFVTDTGKVVRIPYKKNVTRERRKLKKLKAKMDVGKVSYNDILNSYLSWRGSNLKYNSYKTIQGVDKVFKEVYGLDIRDEIKRLKKQRRMSKSYFCGFELPNIQKK